MVMRSTLVVLLLLAACKGDEDSEPAKPKLPETQSVVPEEALPSHFPLPESKTRKLVRSSSKIAMSVWEYEYKDIDEKQLATRLESAMNAAKYAVTSTPGEIIGTFEGRTYAVALRSANGAAYATIRSFPASGPTTLPAPSSYPAKFPFVAGGTASYAPSGSQLRIAYTQDAKDIETAMIYAAKSAG